MRDEMEARIWNDHHDAFTPAVREILESIRQRAPLGGLQASAPRLLLIGMVAITLSLFSLGVTVA